MPYFANDNVETHIDMQQRRSKRPMSTPKPDNCTAMREDKLGSPYLHERCTGGDRGIDGVGSAARVGGKRRYVFVDMGDRIEGEAEHEGSQYGPIIQQKFAKEETLSAHLTLRNKLIATLTIPVPNTSDVYTQTDIIPKLIVDITDVNTDLSGYLFHPPLLSCKIPKCSPYTPWIADPTSPNTYKSTGVNGYIITVTPTLILRTFDTASKRYLRAYKNPALLPIDINSKAWVTRYHKWIHQTRSRKDPLYKTIIQLEFWTIAERRELYTCINEYVHVHGLSAFQAPNGGRKAVIKDDVFRAWAGRINLVGGSSRSSVSVRSQVFKARRGADREIADLLKRAEVLRRKMGTDGVDDEWLQYAIPLQDFPTETKDAVQKGEGHASDEKGSSATAVGVKRKAERKRGDDDGQIIPLRRAKMVHQAPSNLRDRTRRIFTKARALSGNKGKNAQPAIILRRKMQARVAKARAVAEKEIRRINEKVAMTSSSQQEKSTIVARTGAWERKDNNGAKRQLSRAEIHGIMMASMAKTRASIEKKV